ncbi:MAG: hypothetical protein C0623_11280 [Desulfuromonas sp.]|nr:MAG: hypothetical protein C0623_11280 [Desulfuromonas sp.]
MVIMGPVANEWKEIIMEMVLGNGEIVSIDGDARKLVISCRYGDLWITQPGDPADHLVPAGQQFVVSRKGRIAVTALSDARMHIADPIELKQACLPWQLATT